MQGSQNKVTVQGHKTRSLCKITIQGNQARSQVSLQGQRKDGSFYIDSKGAAPSGKVSIIDLKAYRI